MEISHEHEDLGTTMSNISEIHKVANFMRFHHSNPQEHEDLGTKYKI